MPTAAPTSAPSPTPPDALESTPTRWLVVRGLAALVFGILAAAMPVAAIASLLLLFSAWLLVEGGLQIATALRTRRAGGPWRPTLVVGVAHLLASVATLLLPAATLVALVWLLAAWSIVVGVSLVAEGLRARRTPGRWWRVAGGALSIVWGILLVVAPFLGALVLTVWLGAYAIAVGVGLLVLAWRRRRAVRDGGAPGHGADRPRAAA